MKIFFGNLIAISVVLTPTLSWGGETRLEQLKIREVIEGHRVTCSNFEPALMPTLNFETVGSRVLLNPSATQVSIQMNIVYFRCQKDAMGDSNFTLVNPTTPYHYQVEQFDGTTTSVKVSSQQYRFTAAIANSQSYELRKGVSARVDSNGQIYNIRFDFPIDQLLNASQRQLLMKGSVIPISLRVTSALSTNYRIGAQTQEETGFRPTTAIEWEFKLLKNRGVLKAEIVKVRSRAL
jgi:hypothetical protein